MPPFAGLDDIDGSALSHAHGDASEGRLPGVDGPAIAAWLSAHGR